MNENAELKPPGMTIAQAIENLSVHRSEWGMLLDFITTERENYIKDLGSSDTPHDAMRLAGTISTLEELRQTLTPPNW